MKRISILTSTITPLAALLAVLMLSGTASAERYKKLVHGKEVVVHTNPIPVILHRMVPPQYGRHVTQRELSKGTMPQSRATPAIRKR